jgi:hypothetical protein
MSQATAGGFASVRRLIAFAFLLAAVLYLMLFYLTSDALSPSGAQTGNPFAGTQAEIDSALVGERSIQFHLGDIGADRQADAIPFTRAYFTAVYLHYPRRVFVGDDNSLVNFPADLLAADHLPSTQWMHDHQVSGLFTIYGGSQSQHLRVFEVP